MSDLLQEGHIIGARDLSSHPEGLHAGKGAQNSPFSRTDLFEEMKNLPFISVFKINFYF